MTIIIEGRVVIITTVQDANCSFDERGARWYYNPNRLWGYCVIIDSSRTDCANNDIVRTQALEKQRLQIDILWTEHCANSEPVQESLKGVGGEYLTHRM